MIAGRLFPAFADFFHPISLNERLIMDYRRLGASGFTVPVLSFGTGTFGGKGDFFGAWGNTDVAEARRLVDIYSDGVAEAVLGEAIKGRRDRVLLSTKATFRTGEGPNAVGSSRYHLIQACDAALKRLGTDYIDLFQLHGFDALTPVEEVLSTLDDLVRAGKIRYVGVSNFSGWNLDAGQVARLDAASAVTVAYPYWHQRGFTERNPLPV